MNIEYVTRMRSSSPSTATYNVRTLYILYALIHLTQCSFYVSTFINNSKFKGWNRLRSLIESLDLKQDKKISFSLNATGKNITYEQDIHRWQLNQDIVCEQCFPNGTNLFQLSQVYVSQLKLRVYSGHLNWFSISCLYLLSIWYWTETSDWI